MANCMTKKHGISRLLHDLKELYYRPSAMDLRKRMSLYHRNTRSNEAPDISASLANHLDKLTPVNKSNSANVASTTETMSSTRPMRSDNAKQASGQPRGIIRAVFANIRPNPRNTASISVTYGQFSAPPGGGSTADVPR